ncbi:MAG TPA: phosphotransferase [Ktedonobacterales bacterium]|nr:phosphotransferase [Ktedonobacterales bacterium]
MDLTFLDSVWGLTAPWRVEALGQGTNNRVMRIETTAGRYVLRLYGNHADEGRVEVELQILATLATQHLSFAVPSPVPTRQGARYAGISTTDGEVLAVLTTWIAGDHPHGDDLVQAEAAGEALGRLDQALADVHLNEPEAVRTWRSYGDLAHCHPLVPEPPEAIATLPVPDVLRQRLLGRYTWLTDRIPALYMGLPQQFMHEDYAPSNVLLQETRVTGVLDFEFCARDVRAMDLTVALSWWPVRVLGTGNEWPIIRAFTMGYARQVRLGADELTAIPVLYELRAYTSLIHRLGRYRQGLSSLAAVVARAQAALERADWLRDSGERFVGTLLACF